MKNGFELLDSLINSYRNDLIKTMENMISIRAISPKNGGNGESDRADFLEDLLTSWGLRIQRHTYVDDSGIKRPSITARLNGTGRTVWYVGHIDTVTEGDISMWSRDPFKAFVEGNRIYGRGTNDDGQGILSSMYALKALKESGLKTRYDFGLVLAADEENGSRYGMQKLVEERMFNKEDMFVVPDWMTPNGTAIEIGEKGMLWLKITVIGKQMHASTPENGKNAYRQMILFLNDVDLLLHSKYNSRNNIFRPNISTFEMTKHEKNVDSINIIPGIEVSYMDCRILPEYNIDHIISDIKTLAASEKFEDVRIDVAEILKDEPAPITDPNSEIVKLLGSAIKDLRGKKVETVGIGGGTCAAFPRRAGMQAVVWSTGPETAHSPNEYTDINDIINDAKVFAYMLL
jgi:succinyl-diaminopimelate desuccinylase